MYHRSDVLPRRAFLGVEVGSDLRVARVLEGGASASAGLARGDRIVAIDGRSIHASHDLAEAGRGVRGGSRVTFCVEREGRELELSAEAPLYPVEPGCVLGQVESNGNRLRTFYALPPRDGRKPAVLFLQSVRADSCESPFRPTEPRAFVDAFVRAGFVVMRLERAGVGDSEGPSPRETALDVEIAGYRAALSELAAFDEVDPERVFLFGHSFGGMIAPLLATPVAGICVVGTSARRWHECMLGTTKRQREMTGRDPDVPRWTRLFDLVFREGLTPRLAFERDPDLRALRSRDCDGETMHGRHVSLFQELDARDLAASWQSVSAPVLAMHGEHDWICTSDESREIAALTNGTFAEIAGSSHAIDDRILARGVAWASD